MPKSQDTSDTDQYLLELAKTIQKRIGQNGPIALAGLAVQTWEEWVYVQFGAFADTQFSLEVGFLVFLF